MLVLPLKRAQKKLIESGAHPAIMGVLQGMYGFVQFRPKSELPALLTALRRFFPYSFEMHGKFHYLSEDCVEPSIPYDEILQCLKNPITTVTSFVNTRMRLAAGVLNLQSVCLQWKKRILGK